MLKPTTVETVSIDDRNAGPLYRPIGFSWGSVLAGVAIALVIQFLLNLLGAGIGAAVIDPRTTGNPSAGTLSMSSAVWFVVSGIIASFIGGFVASRLSGRARSTGGLHGLTMWAATTLVLLYLVTTSVGALVSGAFAGLGNMVSGAGSTIATAATTAAPSIANAGNPFAGIEQQIRTASGGNDPESLRDAALSSMQALVTGDEAKAEEARTRAADALAKAENIPVEQARQQVAQYEQQYREGVEQAKQQATEAAAQAATAFSTASLFAFVSLVLGAVAAFFGGRMGANRPTA